MTHWLWWFLGFLGAMLCWFPMLELGHFKGWKRGVEAGKALQLVELNLLPGTVRQALTPSIEVVHVGCGGGEWGKWEKVEIILAASGKVVDMMERECNQCGYLERRKLIAQ